MKIIAIGEVLWDILPGAEHLGGAPFNFAWHARNLGHDVSFIVPWVMMIVAAARWN